MERVIVLPEYVRISPTEELPSIAQFRWFRAVVILDADYSREWQDKVSRWLVDNGCLYMMAWGPNATTWDDSVDWANIEAFNCEEIPDERHVMTTWHDDQTLEDVLWQAQFCANDPYGMIRHTLLLHVGSTDRGDEFLSLFVHAADFAEREAGESRTIQ